MPFYPWLHRLAAERLEAVRLRHAPTEADDGPLEASATLVTAGATLSREVGLGPEADTSSGPAPLCEENHRRARIALESLPPQDREILILHYLEELGFPDMAAILGLDVRAVKKRHLQALRRMSAFIAAIGRDLGGGP
jgi:RNA polymerase sigma-70 factor (ECF subfamily)